MYDPQESIGKEFSDAEPTLIKDENLLSDDDKNEIDDIRQIIYSTAMEFHNFEYPKYINNYKKYIGFVQDRAASIEDWQVNVDYPLVASVVDTMYSNIYDFGYEFGVQEPKLADFFRDAFDFRGAGKEVFKHISKEMLICGKAFVRDFLIMEEVNEKYFGEKFSTTIKIPSFQYISIFDVMYDRVVGLNKSPYKIYRTFMSGESLHKTVFPQILVAYPQDKRAGKKKLIDAKLKELKDCMHLRFSCWDYNPIKFIASYSQLGNSNSNKAFYSVDACKTKGDLNILTEGDFDETRNNMFLNRDKGSYEYVEYITAEKKYFFINGAYFGCVEKQKYIGEIHEASAGVVPGTAVANSVADNLGGLQDIMNMLWNSFLDNVRLNLGPMFKVTGNLPMTKSGKIGFSAFKLIRANGQSDIEKISLGSESYAPLQFMDKVQSFSDIRSGLNNYITGGQGAIERVSDGVSLKESMYKSKLVPITDAIDQMMGHVVRSWVQMVLKFYTEDQLLDLGITVTKVYDDKNKFKSILVNDIDLKSIIDERNISFSYNSMDKISKESTRKVVLENLQYMLQYIPNKLNMDELAKLFMNEDFDVQSILKQVDEAQQASQAESQTEGYKDYSQGDNNSYSNSYGDSNGYSFNKTYDKYDESSDFTNTYNNSSYTDNNNNNYNNNYSQGSGNNYDSTSNIPDDKLFDQLTQ